MTSWVNHLRNLDQNWSRYTGLECVVRAILNNKFLLLYLFSVGFLAYASDIFTFSMRIDSENHAFYWGAQGSWVSQGRWGMYLLNLLLLPDSIMPVIPTLIAVVGAVVGAAFFMHALSPIRSLADFIAAPLAIACPVIYFAFYFTTLGYGVGVAFAVTGLGVYLLSLGQWSAAALAALCFCFGIGVYQAVLPLIAAMFGLYIVSFVINRSDFSFADLIKHIALFLFSLIAGYALYAIISKLFLHFMGIAFDSGYMSGFVNYQMTASYFLQAIEKTYPVAVHYYTGGKDYYLYDLLSLKLLCYFTLTVTVLRIVFAASSWLVRVLTLLLLGAVLVAPMAMHLINNGYMPPRTVLGVPQVLAGLVFFAMGCRSNIVRSITAILAIACLYNFCVANNRYALSNAMVWQADRELSVRIQQQIARVLPKISPTNDPWQDFPVELVGWKEYPETAIFSQREVIGASFYKWAAGDVERVTRLFRTMGVDRFRPATREERLSVIEKAKAMPSWPYEGSVDVINGIIVVKLREYNPNQLMAICQPPYDTTDVCKKNYPQ